ncbi:diguanylate cyclase [Actinomycetes bacterium M1A6_2h]
MAGHRQIRLGANERATRNAIAVMTVCFGILSMFIVLSDEGPASPVSSVLSVLVAISTVPVALWWYLRGRLRTLMSPWFVIYADAGVTINSVLFDSRDLAFFATNLFVVIGYFALFLVGRRATRLHLCVVVAVTAYIAWSALDTGQLSGWSVASRVGIGLLVNVGGLIFVSNFNLEVRAVMRTQEDLVHTDPLTGLLNRRGFERDVDRLVERAETGEESGDIAVLSIDIDSFKSVNDNHGHAAGDEVIKLVAARLAASLGENASIARSGGEEFTAAVPTTDRTALHELGEQVRAAVNCETDVVPVTVSVGVTPLDSSRPEPLMSALRTADSAMYRAKRAGGDRTHATESGAI